MVVLMLKSFDLTTEALEFKELSDMFIRQQVIWNYCHNIIGGYDKLDPNWI